MLAHSFFSCRTDPVFCMMKQAFTTEAELLDEHVIWGNFVNCVATVNYERTDWLFFKRNVEKWRRKRGRCVGNVWKVGPSRRQRSQLSAIQRFLLRALISCCSRRVLRSEKCRNFPFSATLMARRAKERASSYFPCSCAKHAWSKSASASR